MACGFLLEQDGLLDSLSDRLYIFDSPLIGVFDHQAHVAAHPEGKIAPEIKDSKHVLLCLSNAIPNPLIAAVRPRAIVSCEGGLKPY